MSTLFWKPFRLVVLREILLSRRQWLVFAVTGAFFAMTWLFQLYLNAYHTRFIAALQGIYPDIYLPVYARGSAEAPEGFRHEKEIFDSGRPLRFRLEEAGADIRLKGIGLRAAAPNRLDPLTVAGGGTPTIFVNEALEQRLGGIRTLQLVGAREQTLRVNVVTFSLPGHEPWLVTTRSVAEKLAWRFNILAVYSDLPAAEETTRAVYGEMGLRPWFWYERLPFLQLVLYRVGKIFARALKIGLLLLTATLALGLLGDLFRELNNLVKMSTLYGVGRTQPVLAFLSLATGYGLALLGATNVTAYACHGLLSRYAAGLQDSFKPLIPHPTHCLAAMGFTAVFVTALVWWENRHAHHLMEV